MNLTYEYTKITKKDDVEVFRPLVDQLFKLQAERAEDKWKPILSSMTIESRLHPDFEAEIFPYADTQLIMVKDEAIDRYVGFAYSTMGRDKKGNLKLYFLEEAYRGKGIGSKLFEDAMEFIEAHQPEEVLIAVSNGNEQALGFYMSKGFRYKSMFMDGMVTLLTNLK
ncbi:GNAT family N-acetyltransferase [Candidatus Bathyarchaeota archaeon]|jgi:GNAT superfamily N-acetyltransferase|nr:GNAT family N-acetyltransferase [Candidatus Bathyarchaeota archaeon]MBT4320263.1 GNAT family N-acetyltransferase [Candidatus Bathyarchaeota archaeon]MBT6604882.1 GNAT family N-acetyltransferase [Candidatus Bathyarchaeota archaeon]MBT7187135.1 GNAT family N-acetyltransferase [Candidatus Bathyarchaeota archaeon]